MKTVQTITTTELEGLEHKYRNPATLEESCILKGVQAELKDRWGDFDPQKRNLVLEQKRPANHHPGGVGDSCPA